MDLFSKAQFLMLNNFNSVYNSVHTDLVTVVKYIRQINFFQFIMGILYSAKDLSLLKDNKTFCYAMYTGLVTIFILLWITVGQKNLSALFRSRNCRVHIHWNELTPNTVGGIVIMKIEVYEFLPCLESLRDLIESVTINVMLVDEEIPVEKTVLSDLPVINAKFKVDKAGLYRVRVFYKGFEVRGSPFSAKIDPEAIDPRKSRLSLDNPIILVQGHQAKVDILPFDSYGNRCCTTNDDLLRLSFNVKKFLSSNLEQEIDPTTRQFQYTFGVRRELELDPSALTSCYTVHVKSLKVGNYVGNVLYNGVPITLPNERMEFICISTEEETMLKEFEYTKSSTFMAKRIPFSSDSNGISSGPTTLHIELSPKFFYINDDILGKYVTKRLSTLRIGPNTKLQVLSIEDPPETGYYCLEITDSLQNVTEKMIMPGRDARVFIVLFHKFRLYSNSDAQLLNDKLKFDDSLSSMSLESKIKTLYKGVRELYSDSNLLLNGDRNTKKFRILNIKRSEIVESTLREIKSFDRYDWGKPFLVFFEEDRIKHEVIPPWVQWAETLLDIFLENNAHGMFCSFGSSSFIHPNPNRNSRWTKEHYKLAGQIVGKYLVETAFDKDGKTQYFTNARFTRSFLAQLIYVLPNFKHMEFDDPEEYISTFIPILYQDVEPMNLNFTGPVYDQYGNIDMKELIANGNSTLVTNENKLQYLNALANLRLQQNVEEEINAFIDGFTTLIPDSSLLMKFDENELELLLCGSSGVTINEIKQNHVCNSADWNPHVPRIMDWLWNSLMKMSPLDIGRFLQFLTGSSRLPYGGFSTLQPKLKISVSGLYGQLPSCNKTLHHLCLPAHPTFESFHAALISAIRKT